MILFTFPFNRNLIPFSFQNFVSIDICLLRLSFKFSFSSCVWILFVMKQIQKAKLLQQRQFKSKDLHISSFESNFSFSLHFISLLVYTHKSFIFANTFLTKERNSTTYNEFIIIILWFIREILFSKYFSFSSYSLSSFQIEIFSSLICEVDFSLLLLLLLLLLLWNISFFALTIL